MTIVRALIPALLSLLVWPVWGQTPAAQIWFNPREPSGWLGMFRDDSAWKQAASRVDVLVLEPSFVVSASDADILTLTNYAARNGKKLAFVAQAVARPTNIVCGGTEGYAYPGEMKILGVKLKNLNVHVDYLMLDEPLWFGSMDTEPLTCQLPVPDLVVQVGLTVNDFKGLYPRIRVVEIEPARSVVSQRGWQTALSAFQTGLWQQTGLRVEAIHLDVDWHDPAAFQDVAAFDAYVRETNGRLGIIYNGTGADPDVQSWIATAINAFETVEGRMGILPSLAEIISWNEFPVQNLPETDPTTLTWLLDRYVRSPSRIHVYANPGATTGKLTDWAEKPIAGAAVKILLPGNDPGQPLPRTVWQSTAPAGAASIIVGARLNTECNGCNGKNDVLLGTFVYQETAGGSVVQTYTYPVASSSGTGLYTTREVFGGTQVSRIIVMPGTNWLANSDFLPVTGGAQFTLTVPGGTIGGEGWNGHAVIFFFDANRNLLASHVVTFPPVQQILASTLTAADGTFSLPRFPSVGRGGVPPTVTFPGDAQYRAASWSRPR